MNAHQQHIKQWSWLAAILVLCLTWLSWCLPVGADNSKIITQELEAEVLEIIRSHPEVVWESLQTYLAQQQQREQQAQQVALQEITSNPEKAIASSPTTGSQEQKIVLLEFSDFQCPYCGKATETVKDFMNLHGDEVTLAYKHYPLTSIHPQAMAAAKASWAANRQGKFWEYHDGLFAQQKKLGEEFYLALAEELNLDLEQFNRDRRSDGASQGIQQDIQMAETLGIKGTPFFVMNQETLSGAVPLAQMESVLAKVKSQL